MPLLARCMDLKIRDYPAWPLVRQVPRPQEGVCLHTDVVPESDLGRVIN